MHLPTKLHWRDPAKLRYVEAGLADMSRALAELRVQSVAVPALGCGLGGLYWADVEPLIRSTAHGSSVRWVIYGPRS